MRVGLLSKITRNGCSKSSFLKFNSSPSPSPSPFLSSSTHCTLSSKICTHNGVSGTIRNEFLPTSILATRFFSNALLKKYPLTISNRRFAHWSTTSLNRHRRSIFRWFTSDGVVMGLIITNVAVFMLWKVADTRFMVQNFMISVDNFTSGRIHTLITSAFSHRESFHLISNMIGLYFFGTSYLLKLYLGGAIAGSVFYLVYHAFLAESFQNNHMRGISPSKIPALGASGAVNAIVLLDIFLFPTQTVYFEMFIPMPAILLGVFIIGHDFFRVWKGDPHVSGAAHLGGATVAALAWLRMRKGRF